jgi:hypothetical protein
MKPTTIFAALLTFAACGVASPTPEEGISVDPRTNTLEARKGCSGQREVGDKCSGKNWGHKTPSITGTEHCNPYYIPSLVGQRLTICSKNWAGKCCAKNKDGSGGLDASRGQGREDCGFCFSGECMA